MPPARLIMVAHAGDETISFSSVLPGARVAAVIEPKAPALPARARSSGAEFLDPRRDHPKNLRALPARARSSGAEPLFPSARFTAIEADPRFAKRLRERLPGLTVLEHPLEDAALPLEADLIVAAEVLNYVPAPLEALAARLRAKHLLTCYRGGFDDRLATALRALGRREQDSTRLPVRLECVERSPFLVRRVGAVIRLWQRD